MKRLRQIGVVIAWASLLCPRAARAQAASPAPPPVTTGFDNGFFIQGNNGDYRLVFGLTVQMDGRFSLDDPLPITNTFTIRKVRPTFSGRVAKYFEFKVMPDFGNGATVLQDAFVDTRFSTSNAFRLRAGKDKTPIGYELLIGDTNLFFPERSLASSLVPNRDVGVQGMGELAGGRFSYQGGLFNGVPDASSSTTDVDTNNGKEFAGKVVVQPWRSSPASAASGLGFHLAGSVGDQAGTLPHVSNVGGSDVLSYATGATAGGQHTRVTPAAFYFYKPVGVFAEYIASTQDVARNGATHAIANHGVNVTAAWYLTGEPATAGITRPRKPFDPAAGHWGAAQVLTRYSRLDVDDDAFTNNLAASGASRRANQWTVAFNWYPTSFTKWYATYERTAFDNGAPGSRPVENVIIFRAQLAF